MKFILCILPALVLFVFPAPAMDRLDALSQLESHDNDRAVGSQHEVSRYQILPEFWAGAWTLKERTEAAFNPADPMAARVVVNWIMQARCSAFETRYHHAPDDFEYYILWHRPACFIGRTIPRHITTVEADRGRRFACLCQSHAAVALRQNSSLKN